MSVDPDAVFKSNTVPAKYRASIAKEMEWTFTENFASKANLAMFDILVNNNWERPIYFGSGIFSTDYIELEKYLLSGRICTQAVTHKPTSGDTREINEVTNSDVMFDNVLKKFDFKGFTTAKYLDPESRESPEAVGGL